MTQPLIMTVRIVGGEPQRVTEALRRAGLALELELLGEADTAWTIRHEEPPTSGQQWAQDEHTEALREGRGCYHCAGLAWGITQQKRGAIIATSVREARERRGDGCESGA